MPISYQIVNHVHVLYMTYQNKKWQREWNLGSFSTWRGPGLVWMIKAQGLKTRLTLSCSLVRQSPFSLLFCSCFPFPSPCHLWKLSLCLASFYGSDLILYFNRDRCFLYTEWKLCCWSSRFGYWNEKKWGKQILKVREIIFQDNVLAYEALSLLHYPICISEAECLLPFFILTVINGFF